MMSSTCGGAGLRQISLGELEDHLRLVKRRRIDMVTGREESPSSLDCRIFLSSLMAPACAVCGLGTVVLITHNSIELQAFRINSTRTGKSLGKVEAIGRGWRCPEVHAELCTSVTVPRQRDRATLLCEDEGLSGCRKHCEVISMASSFDTRHLVRLRVQLNGVDCAGHRFKQTAFTHDVSMRGARLEDAPLLVEPASVVEVRHHGKRGRFRVVWVGGLGGNQVGLESLESSKCIWGRPLPG